MSFRDNGRSDQKTRLCLEPFPDNANALLPIRWPSFRKYVVSNFVGFDAEHMPDHFGRLITVITIDRSFEKIGHLNASQTEWPNHA
jgi:hypothetical protein